MAKYKITKNRALNRITLEDRLSNQVIVSGTDQSITVQNGFVLVETLLIASGSTIDITDGNGTAVVSGVFSDVPIDAPMLLEGGVTFTGTILIAVVSVFEGVYKQ